MLDISAVIQFIHIQFFLLSSFLTHLSVPLSTPHRADGLFSVTDDLPKAALYPFQRGSSVV